MKVHLVDGTYELFRHHYGVPAPARAKGSRSAATRGVLGFVLRLLEEGATHVAVATDHVIESFRNRLWPGYKDGSGLPEDLRSQFPLAEEALAAMGVCVWPMVALEADDGLATGAAVACEDDAVEQVIIHTPDKDLGQCVVGDRVVQRDWRRGVTLDEAGVVARFGVAPPSVPDWLALVGDPADGFPGLKGWGRATASAVLARYHHLEAIPALGQRWEVNVSRASELAASLRQNWDLALLFRDLATLRVDRSLVVSVEELRWGGPGPGFEEVCGRLKAAGLAQRAQALSSARA